MNRYWCCRAWCYVDAETCDGGEVPYFTSFAQSGEYPTLFYSFAACDYAYTEDNDIEPEVS